MAARIYCGSYGYCCCYCGSYGCPCSRGDELIVVAIAVAGLQSTLGPCIPTLSKVPLVAFTLDPFLRERVLGLGDRQDAKAVEEVVGKVANLAPAGTADIGVGCKLERAFAVALGVELFAVVEIAVRILESPTTVDRAVVSQAPRPDIVETTLAPEAAVGRQA